MCHIRETQFVTDYLHDDIFVEQQCRDHLALARA